MNNDSILTIASNTLELAEELICGYELDDKRVVNKLEKQLRYSTEHLRHAFKISTNMTLRRYIKRRIYTKILMEMTEEEFRAMPKNKAIFQIKNFKGKCLKEFPSVLECHCLENMQKKLDKTEMKKILEENVIEEQERYWEEKSYKDIIRGRAPYIIEEEFEKVVIQSKDEIIIDIDKTYFVYGDTVFKITANTKITEKREGIGFYSHPMDTIDSNVTIKFLNDFLMHKKATEKLFYAFLEWDNKRQCGGRNLISCSTFYQGKLESITFMQPQLLCFRKGCVFLDIPLLAKEID